VPPQKGSSNVTPPLSSSSAKTPPVPPAPAKPKGQQFKPGDRVRHDKFGEGTILKSEMQEDTEFVEVQFDSKFGKKRLSMDFAKLEKL
jgi:DNA helicase-2/ATP-dependent DNA helicase PcrA